MKRSQLQTFAASASRWLRFEEYAYWRSPNSPTEFAHGKNVENHERNLKCPRQYLMTNGYKPSPIDLSHVRFTEKMEELVEELATNAHNVWASERIKQGKVLSNCKETGNPVDGAVA